MGRAFALWTMSNFYSTTQPRFGLMGRRSHRGKDPRISSHPYLSHPLRRLGMEKPWSSLGSSSTNCTHLRWQPLSNINPTWNYPTRILMFVIHRSQSTNGLQWWQGKLEQGTITSMRAATVGTWGILTHILTSWTCSSWTRAWHLLPQSAQTQYFLRKDWSLTRHFSHCNDWIFSAGYQAKEDLYTVRQEEGPTQVLPMDGQEDWYKVKTLTTMAENYYDW